MITKSQRVDAGPLQRRDHELTIARPQHSGISRGIDEHRVRVRPGGDYQGVTGLKRAAGSAQPRQRVVQENRKRDLQWQIRFGETKSQDDGPDARAVVRPDQRNLTFSEDLSAPRPQRQRRGNRQVAKIDVAHHRVDPRPAQHLRGPHRSLNRERQVGGRRAYQQVISRRQLDGRRAVEHDNIAGGHHLGVRRHARQHGRPDRAQSLTQCAVRLTDNPHAQRS